MYRVVGRLHALLFHRGLILIDDLSPPGRGIFPDHFLKLSGDDTLHPSGMVQNVLQVSDLLFQFLCLRHPLQDILLIDVPKPNIRHISRLGLIDPKADHQVGNHLRVLLSVPDNLDGPVDVQQDLLQPLQ